LVGLFVTVLKEVGRHDVRTVISFRRGDRGAGVFVRADGFALILWGLRITNDRAGTHTGEMSETTT
jgi:hypothetical protein